MQASTELENWREQDSTVGGVAVVRVLYQYRFREQDVTRCIAGLGGLVGAVQAGLLTHLTFARHRLSPLAAFTSGPYFLHNGRR